MTGEDGITRYIEEVGRAVASRSGIAGVRGFDSFRDADEKALREVIRRNERQIQTLRSQFGNLGADMEIARLQAENMNAKKELKFRSDVMRDYELGGYDRALRNFSGDPLLFKDVLANLQSGREDSAKIIDELRENNRLLRGKFRAQ